MSRTTEMNGSLPQERATLEKCYIDIGPVNIS
jgi:hypothetical protein